MNPTILYVLGAGNSGSTLLSMAMGAHPEITSIGELVAIDRWYADGNLCSCGSRLDHCDRWGPVIGDKRTNNPFPVAPLENNPWLAKSSKKFKKERNLGDVLQRNWEIYSYISQVTGSRYIVDSSENPLHFYYLRRSGLFRIIPIFLFRRGEGYVNSAANRGISPYTATVRWIKSNLKSEFVLRECDLHKKAVRVTYERLVAEPEKTLASLSEAIGLKYDSEMLDFPSKPHHNIAGNRTRLNPRPIDPSMGANKKPKFGSQIVFNCLGGGLVNYFYKN